MRKSILNERAARAFRNYARLGLSSADSALDVAVRIRGICNDEVGLDLLAVFDTLRLLEATGQNETLDAIRCVYFETAFRRIHANEISLIILRLSRELHLDERTVYRRLQRARSLWHYLRSNSRPAALGTRGMIRRLY